MGPVRAGSGGLREKPIIGIRQLRSKDISSAISEVAQEVVGWNPEALLAAIKEHSVCAATNL